MPYEEPAAEQAVPPRQHRRHFSRLGLGLTVCIVVDFALSMAVYVLFIVLDKLGALSYDQAVNGVPFWVAAYILPCALGLVSFYLIVRRLPFQTPEERHPLALAPFAKVYFISVAVLTVFGYLTDVFMSIIASLRGVPVFNPVDSLFSMPMYISALLSCVAAPIMEELAYRRLLIPRLRLYGDRFAVIASALCFGLMHGNLNQFFYAFALGVVLGHVFLKTGCVWQTILLHALVNLSAGIVPSIAEHFGDLGGKIYLLFVMGHVALGASYFQRRERESDYAPGAYPLEQGQKWRFFFLNFGMICFCLLFAAQSVWYLLE